MLYQLKTLCTEYKLNYKTLVKRIQRLKKSDKKTFRFVKIGRDWCVDEETKRELLGKEQGARNKV